MSVRDAAELRVVLTYWLRINKLIDFFFCKSGKPLNQLPNQPAMELRGIRGIVGGQDTKCQGLGFGYPVTGIPTSSVITAVQQQDYSASVWLRRRDKLEHVSSDTGDEVLDTAERRVKS